MNRFMGSDHIRKNHRPRLGRALAAEVNESPSQTEETVD
jgi:hypothetical protein